MLKKIKVIKINKDKDEIEFENNIKLFSDHFQECCEYHYLYLNDLTLEDFEGLEFDLSNDNFLRKIDGYGIELIPIRGHSVKIPAYGENNGCYSSELLLILKKGENFRRIFDISECQKIKSELC